MQENKFKVGQLYEVTSSYEQGNIIEIVRVDDNYKYVNIDRKVANKLKKIKEVIEIMAK